MNRWARRVTLFLCCAVVAAGRMGAAQQPTPIPIPGFVRCDVPIPASAGDKTPVPVAITKGDFDPNDLDTTDDLAVVDAANSRVVVLLTHRNAFASGDCDHATTASDVPVPANPVAIAAGEIDTGRGPDLVVAGALGVSILRNNGSGSFTADPTPLPVGKDPRAVVVADVNRDGLADIVVANGSNGNSVTILYGLATRGFAAAQTLAVNGPVSFMVVDVLNRVVQPSSEGRFPLDIAAGTPAAPSGQGEVSVFLQDTSGAFVTPPVSFAVGAAPAAMVSGDFNEDQIRDVAVAGGGRSGELKIFLGPFDGSVPASFAVSTGQNPSALAADDFNQDGKLDVVVANQDDATLSFFVGNGQAELTEQLGVCRDAAERCPVGAAPASLVLADVDGDRFNDVITANRDAASISVLLSSRPPPTPTSTTTPTATATPTSTPTPTRTPTDTPTRTPTNTPTPTSTRTPVPTSTATVTPTGGSQCVGGICIQGQSCAVAPPSARGTGLGQWLLPVAIIWLWRRRR